jgi:hypothetical protein
LGAIADVSDLGDPYTPGMELIRLIRNGNMLV